MVERMIEELSKYQDVCYEQDWSSKSDSEVLGEVILFWQSCNTSLPAWHEFAMCVFLLQPF
jgi:hypothetical protein